MVSIQPEQRNLLYLSVLKMSATTFHCLSACFFQTTTYLPISVVGFPLASLNLSSKVPTSYAMSPDFATSILVEPKLNANPGIDVSPTHTFLICSLPVAIGALNGNADPSSA